jgi:hypothetical protein
MALPGKGGKTGKITTKNRQYEENYGIRYFIGKNNEGIEVTDVLEDGRIMFRFVKDFVPSRTEKDEKGKDVVKPGSVTVQGYPKAYSPEAFHLAIQKFGCSPHIPPREVEAKPIEEVKFESSSLFKKFFQYPSWHDIMAGLGKIPESIKHHLEHSSKHHSAHVALAVAQKLPFFPEEWLTDFERELFSEDKKMLEEAIEHLTGLNPPRVRQKHIRKWLLEKNSTHNEIIASICTMLEKHGSLYAGELKSLEGKWVYFARLP